METTWRQNEDKMETTVETAMETKWRQIGDKRETKWRQNGDIIETKLRQNGDQNGDSNEDKMSTFMR